MAQARRALQQSRYDFLSTCRAQDSQQCPQIQWLRTATNSTHQQLVPEQRSMRAAAHRHKQQQIRRWRRTTLQRRRRRPRVHLVGMLCSASLLAFALALGTSTFRFLRFACNLDHFARGHAQAARRVALALLWSAYRRCGVEVTCTTRTALLVNALATPLTRCRRYHIVELR